MHLITRIEESEIYEVAQGHNMVLNLISQNWNQFLSIGWVCRKPDQLQTRATSSEDSFLSLLVPNGGEVARRELVLVPKVTTEIIISHSIASFRVMKV